MTLDLAAIEARAAAATAGPWVKRITDDFPPGWLGVYEAEADGKPVPFAKLFITGRHDEEGSVANAEFIAAARTDIPALLAAVRTLEAENTDLRTANESVAVCANHTVDVTDRGSRVNGCLVCDAAWFAGHEAETCRHFEGLAERAEAAERRVTALEALLAHAGSYVWVAEQNGGQGLAEAEALSKAIAAALLSKEGVK